MRLIKENLLLLTISLGILLAWFLPEPGMLLRSGGATGPLILTIFLCQGLGFEGKQLQKASQLLKTFCWGFVVSQLLAPALAHLSTSLLNLESDNQVGFMIICCMAPTLVSGVVLASRAGGDGATALLLAVGLNLTGVLTIPINLHWWLGAAVRLDALRLLSRLFLLVLVPAVAGQLMRQRKPDFAQRQRLLIGNVPIVALGIIVYVSCSSQGQRLRELTLGHLGSLLLPSVAVHLILLIAAYGGSRYIFRIQESASRSLAIVCSQKTLPIAIAVWSIAFAPVYPLAVLPALVFHPSQILCDGVIATIWGKHRKSRDKGTR